MMSNRHDVLRTKRHAINKIIVDQIEVSKKINNKLFERIELYGNRSTKSTKQIARHFLEKYLYDSSVHGVKYLGKLRIKSTPLTKLFWISVLICSFVCLSWMFWKTLKRYTSNPTRSVIESFHTPVALVPFPAVTICPLIFPPRTRRLKVLQSLKLPPNMDEKMAMFLLRYGPAFANEHVPGGKDYINDLQALLNANNLTLIKFLTLLRTCEDLFELCSWDGVKKNCSELFKVSFTHSGVCCSFNYRLEEEVRTGRTINDSDLLRTPLFGSRSGLTVVIKRDLINGDVATEEKAVKFSTNSVGLLVYPHHPLEYIGSVSARQLLQEKQELRVAIIPFSDQKISGYYYRNNHDKLVAHCAGEDTKLKYFPTYRYSNCFTSCSIEAVLEICKCLPYYYALIANKYSIRICEWQDFKCLYENTDRIRIIHNIYEDNFTCDCQDPCWDVFYETRYSSLTLNGAHEFNIRSIYRNISETQAILKVYFDTDIFLQMNEIPIADELYLLASVGGIFSLFLGASFISAIEIFYFIQLFFRSYYKEKKSK